MDYNKILICIAIMALVTYALRVFPFLVFKREIKSPFVQSFLTYIPYAILASMTFPEVFYSTGNMISAGVGVIIALILSYLNRGLLTVALCSAAAVFLTEQVMNFIF